MKERKIEYIDISRGFLILLVVFGHAIISPIRKEYILYKFIFYVIYSFHMPAFFIISGYLFSKNLNRYISYGSDWKRKLVIKKFKYLMVPYFSWSLFNYILNFIGNNIPYLSSYFIRAGYKSLTFKETCFAILTFNNHFDSHIWFIYALFLIFIVAIYFNKFIGNKYILPVLAILYLLVSRLFSLPLLINGFLYNLFYFSLGMHTEFIEKCLHLHIKKYAIIIIVFIIGCCLYAAWFTNIFHPEFGKILGPICTELRHYAAAIPGSIIVFKCAYHIGEYPWVKKILGKMSQYSYDIYLMHNPYIVNMTVGLLIVMRVFPFAAILTGTAVGVMLPIFISKYIFNRSKKLSMCFLGK